MVGRDCLVAVVADAVVDLDVDRRRVERVVVGGALLHGDDVEVLAASCPRPYCRTGRGGCRSCRTGSSSRSGRGSASCGSWRCCRRPRPGRGCRGSARDVVAGDAERLGAASHEAPRGERRGRDRLQRPGGAGVVDVRVAAGDGSAKQCFPVGLGVGRGSGSGSGWGWRLASGSGWPSGWGATVGVGVGVTVGVGVAVGVAVGLGVRVGVGVGDGVDVGAGVAVGTERRHRDDPADRGVAGASIRNGGVGLRRASSCASGDRGRRAHRPVRACRDQVGASSAAGRGRCASPWPDRSGRVEAELAPRRARLQERGPVRTPATDGAALNRARVPGPPAGCLTTQRASLGPTARPRLRYSPSSTRRAVLRAREVALRLIDPVDDATSRNASTWPRAIAHRPVDRRGADRPAGEAVDGKTNSVASAAVDSTSDRDRIRRVPLCGASAQRGFDESARTGHPPPSSTHSNCPSRSDC